MSYDLAVNTPKSSSVPSVEYVRSVHNELRHSLEASGAWFELTIHEPQGGEAKWFLENDGFFDPEYKRAFEVFCQQRQIASEPLTEETALRFIVHKDGAHLATVALPRDDRSCATVFRVMVEFAKNRELRIIDPQAGRDVDLVNPGVYPPFWK